MIQLTQDSGDRTAGYLVNLGGALFTLGVYSISKLQCGSSKRRDGKGYFKTDKSVRMIICCVFWMELYQYVVPE